MLFAGQLREKITIEQEALLDDGQGGDDRGSWVPVTGLVGLSAKVRPLSAQEQLAAAQMQSHVTHEVTIRYQSAAAVAGAASWRIRWTSRDDRILDIVGPPINPDLRRVELIFLCREGTEEKDVA